MDSYEEKNFIDKMESWITSLQKNRLITFFKRKTLLRKTIIFYLLLIPIITLFLGAQFSPKKITYSKEELSTEQTFENGTGVVRLDKQYYSKANNIMLFEFTTIDSTSSIERGINPNNLSWSLWSYPGVDASKTSMDVIPLTNNKIYVVVRNVPEDYRTFIVQLDNKTVSEDNVDIDLKDYDDYQKEKSVRLPFEGIKKNNNTSEKDKLKNYVYFFITPQNQELKEKYVQNLSRENFALKLFRAEKQYQVSQKQKLEKSIELLTQRIEEDNSTLSQLEKEAQTLVSRPLEKKQSEIENIRSSISSKEDKIRVATDNINTVNVMINKLKENISSIKDGSYQFISPISPASINKKN
ncbi:TPA: hypothetical protein ACUJUF_001960 [Streptococcus agalactiae]|nr:hypothetical protein [Streptococcus agalactiae]